MSDELPSHLSPIAAPNRRSCSSFAPSAPLGSARTRLSAKATEIPRTESTAVSATSDEEMELEPSSKEQLRMSVKRYIEPLFGPKLDDIVVRLKIRKDVPLYIFMNA